MSRRKKILLFLIDKEQGYEFTSDDVASHFSTPRPEASQMIQDYLTWRRGRPEGIAPVIHRVPGTRTRTAIWRIGDTTADWRQTTHGFAKDVERKFERGTGKDLASMMDNNPTTRARLEGQRRALELQIEAFVAALEAL